jgi:translocation and assembly module TamB
VAVLDVRRLGKAERSAPGKRLAIGLDVALRAPQKILVQGRGLDAEVSGELSIKGTTAAPQISGGFDLRRGKISLAGTNLNFTAGRISFDGADLQNRIDPSIDFTAQASANDTTATLRITGLAGAPKFEFSSTPVLPQDEIMAILLFGQNAAQLTTLQLAQIGAALASLGGVGGDGSLNPLVKIQKSLRLDRLSIGAGTDAATDTANASIEAGRYISERVYVEAKHTSTGTDQLETEIELNKHLKMKTRLSNGSASTQAPTPENDVGNSIGLSYQFEY